jgi:hypothetical protein
MKPVKNKAKFPLMVIAIFIIINLAIVAGLLAISIIIPINGNINTSVNLSCTPNSFNVGTITAGDSISFPVTITNIGNTPLTLTFTYTTPSYITIIWNRDNYILPIGQSIDANFIVITANNSIAGPFAGSITITGTA